MIARYQNEEMRNIWSEDNKFNAWLEVEILASEAFSEMGEIPKEDIKKINPLPLHFSIISCIYDSSPFL